MDCSSPGFDDSKADLKEGSFIASARAFAKAA